MRLVRRVGLIGPPDREELIRLAIRIEERGGEAIMLDSREDPAIEIGPSGVRACGMDLSDLSGCYVADLGIRPFVVRRDDGRPDPEASAATLEASRRHLVVWNTLLARLGLEARVVNPPVTHDLHGLKAWEATIYAEKGLPVPITIATSDPETLLDLRRSYPDVRWICKGLIGGLGYTEAFTPPSSRTEAEELLSQGPVLIQERIEGENVRAYVVNAEVVGAAEVISTHGAETDSRRDLKRVRPIELPDRTAEDVVTTARLWGMSFAAVDLMYDPSRRRFMLLECNSAPFFVGFERLTGIEISSRLAEHLLGR
jgi:glutathione synthase/RimK-type ligase-like ATP-grasp enzyme